MAVAQQKIYTVEDIYALPDGKRAELVDGQLYMMKPPNTIHQEISGGFYYKIRSYIDRKGGECKVFAAPFAVFLNEDRKNYLEPDISVICDRDKINDQGCVGAPDWVIEVVSPSIQQMDYGIKLFKYRTAGVREYWIVNPLKRTVMVYDFEQEQGTGQYVFGDVIPVRIFEDLHMDVEEFLL